MRRLPRPSRGSPGRPSGAAALLSAAVVLVSVLLAGPAPAAAQAGGAERAVLVTGATSGIGLRMTEVLSSSGFHVYAGARSPEDMARLDAMPNVTSVRLDVTIQEDIDAAVGFVEAQGRGLYGLVNNAGIATMEPIIEMPEEVLAYQLDVNLMGPYRVTKAFADLLIEGRGRILNVSSIAGIVTGPFSGAYSMSKHGVEAYTDVLAAEVARFGVQVAAVEPGNYRSKIVESMVRRMRERGYTGTASRYGSMLDMIAGQPLDRSQYQAPDDVALAALAFFTTDTPKRRYMVVPSRGEAEITIRGGLQELAQLNQDQPYAFSRDELVRMLDDALAATGSTADVEDVAEVDPAARGADDGALFEAAVRGDLAALRRAIEAGADVDQREPSGGSTPLIAAALFGRSGAAKALIDAGADVDARNNDGSTALITAALVARTEIVRALLDAGADRGIRNNNGATALEVATAPFEVLRPVYDFLGSQLGPQGLELDLERIEAARPDVAAMLRQ
mgnify:CR=1 FL=1